MSATMFGTTGGPMLGLFSLGILTTRANSKVSQTASSFMSEHLSFLIYS